MQTMGAFEAKTHFSSLLKQVQHGEEFTIVTKTVAILGIVTELC